MTIDELKKHPVFTGLSPQQRLYVIARCLGKDTLGAAKEAWQCNNDASFEAMSNRAEKNANVRWCINEFHGGNLPTLDQVIKQAWNISVNATKPAEKIKALALVAELSGFTKPNPNPPTDPDVDDEEETFEFGTDQGTGSTEVS